MVISVYIAPTLQDAIGGISYDTDIGGNKIGVDHGSLVNGGETTPIVIAIAHNHTEATSDARIYFQQLTPGAGETYDGSFSPASDFARYLTWGDGGDGIKTELDWSDVTPSYATILKTDIADSLINSVQLPASSMAYDDTGTTQPPSTPEDGAIYPIANGDRVNKGEGAQILQKIVCPASETVNGFLEHDMVFLLEFIT